MSDHSQLEKFALDRGISFYPSLISVKEAGQGHVITSGANRFYVSGADEILIGDIQAGPVQSAMSFRKHQLAQNDRKWTIAITTPDVLSRLLEAENPGKVKAVGVESDNKKAASQNEKTVVALIRDMMSRRASDIALVGNKETGKVDLAIRVDGEVVIADEKEYGLDYSLLIDLTSVMVNKLAVENGGDRNDPFDEGGPTRAVFTPPGVPARIRYQHYPSASPRGLSVSLRIINLSTSGRVSSHRELGYSPNDIAHLLPMFGLSHGLVLMTGPTGAGKTSAAAAGLATIPRTRRVLTVEDPVEIILPNAIHFSLPEGENGFEEIGRVLLRKDPDVISIGEIRDFKALDSAIKNASTGHLVFSTLHTNGTLQTISRLYDLGGSPSRLATPSLIRGIFANRLVPSICKDCSVNLETAIADPEVKSRAGYAIAISYLQGRFTKSELQSINISARSTNCKTCRGAGYKGRLPVLESLIIDDAGRRFILQQDLPGYEEYLKGKGWKSLQERAIDLVREGRVCPIGLDSKIDGIYGGFSDYDYNDTQRAESVLKDAHEPVRLNDTRAGFSQSEPVPSIEIPGMDREILNQMMMESNQEAQSPC